jgi:hypothetical protein
MRRLATISFVAVLALSACGGNDSSSNSDGGNSDSTAAAGEGSNDTLCNDITAFIEATGGIPGDSAEETQENIDLMFDSLKAIEESGSGTVDMDYEAMNDVLKDLVSVLEDFDYNVDAIEADPDGAARIQEVAESPALNAAFTSLGEYYNGSCQPPVIGS